MRVEARQRFRLRAPPNARAAPMIHAVFREDRESELIAAYLPPRGFFIEVGAYDPVELSQTFQLEQCGWDGLLIEPVPSHAERLRAVRRVRVLQVACGAPEQNGKNLPIHVAGARSSVRYALGQAICVPVVTIDSILTEAKISRVEFLSVDVEGAEIDVLKGFPFDRIRPDLVLIEDFADDFARHRFMRSKQYKRVRRTGNNSWYVPLETDFPLSLYGRFQLLRKYYLSWPIRHLKNGFRRIARRA
jgi:FkbM family methyltransferase